MRVPVTVVIPFYKADSTIERALTSVVTQSCPASEIIIVDDASGGMSSGYLARLQSKYRSEAISILTLESNRGPGYARNVGWKHAKEGLIAFLDADDSWLPDKLAKQFEYMERVPSVDMCCHGARVGSSGHGIRTATSAKSHELGRWEVLLRNPIRTSTVMIRHSVPFRFEERRRHAEDYTLWKRLVLNGCSCVYLPEVLTEYHKSFFGEGGLSGNLIRMELGELRSYNQLRREHLYSRGTYVTVVGLSVGKFVRRWIIVALKALRQRLAR